MFRNLLAGASNTIFLVTISWAIGLPLGIAWAFLSLNFPQQRIFLRALSVSFSVIPLLAILFWVHYPLQSLLDTVWSPNITSTALLSAFVTIIIADIMAEEMLRTKSNLIETARVLGIPNHMFISKVVFPSSIQGSLPRLLTLAISSVHITMFMSLIGVEELFRVSQRLNAQLLRPVEVFSVMALIYALICLPLYFFASRFKRRIERDNYNA